MDPNEYHARLRFLQSLPPESLLRALLAVVHLDGGRCTDEVGLARSVALAETNFYRILRKAEAFDEIADVVKSFKS